MSEEDSVVMLDTQYVASSVTRRRIVVFTLLFTYSMIVWILLYGSPTNSLHESALSWAFGTNIITMFAYSFGTIITQLFKK